MLDCDCQGEYFFKQSVGFFLSFSKAAKLKDNIHVYDRKIKVEIFLQEYGVVKFLLSYKQSTSFIFSSSIV